ncbi:hypothetical protein SLNWT_3314 [Streptomyces albus]|uniref:Uncharacterized protein n=1 Tax=Streptomyces albus (strain ATCC 21838 / DSM 41398 / FERM P-419 / JCM 4703 / NBRC 107858) TaxID=1081613 RepID=A0A0B5EWV5_STRA4|nr:hypothetical protein SLNWT_3314 [Streptomyces albus]AOU77997.1 hypothetical protein SLNHY_3306 [Streptomyces albus]
MVCGIGGTIFFRASSGLFGPLRASAGLGRPDGAGGSGSDPAGSERRIGRVVRGYRF